MDKYGAFGDGTNVFLEINPYTKKIYSKRKGTDRLSTKLLTSYLLEMYIADSVGDKEIFIDTSYWIQHQPKFNKSNHLQISTIYNLYNDFHPKKFESLSAIATLLLPIAYEQIDIQDGYESHFNRFFAVYGSNSEINRLYFEKYGISLKYYMAIAWGLLAYIVNNKYRFSTNDFIAFMSSTTSTENEIRTFLYLISLTRAEFKKKYEFFRKHDDGTYLEWGEREAVDKALPRVSYFFPLIRDGDVFTLISYTALQEFMKFRGLYRSLTEGLKDLHFKQQYSGPLFEAYVRNMVLKYNINNNLEAMVYGDEKYYISKGKEKRAPDTIIETDDYIVLIECKTSPFSLNLVKYLETQYLHNLEESIKKSVINFDTFLSYSHKNNCGKKITKIIVFYEGIHMAFTMLKEEIKDLSNVSDVFIMDIESLELLLSEYIRPIPEILNGFLDAERTSSTNLNGYIRAILRNEETSIKEDTILAHIVKDQLGLEINNV